MRNGIKQDINKSTSISINPTVESLNGTLKLSKYGGICTIQTRNSKSNDQINLDEYNVDLLYIFCLNIKNDSLLR